MDEEDMINLQQSQHVPIKSTEQYSKVFFYFFYFKHLKKLKI